MGQKAIRAVIDEWDAAMRAMFPDKPPADHERGKKALADIFEVFGTAATNLGIAAAFSVQKEQEAIILKIEAVEARVDRRRATDDDLQHQIDTLSERATAIEEQLPD